MLQNLKVVATKDVLKKLIVYNFYDEDKEMDFEKNLQEEDAKIFDAIELELKRQQDQIELIASENIVSKAILQAQESILTNKYTRGYPHKRYYGGCEFVDMVEDSSERAKKIFKPRVSYREIGGRGKMPRGQPKPKEIKILNGNPGKGKY